MKKNPDQQPTQGVLWGGEVPVAPKVRKEPKPQAATKAKKRRWWQGDGGSTGHGGHNVDVTAEKYNG